MNYQEEAKQARIKVLDLIFRAQTSHIGSNFSCIDILTVLFDKIDLTKDKFILSKGWAAASLYYFLWKKGRITEEELNSYCGKCPACQGNSFKDKEWRYKNLDTVTREICSDCQGTGVSKFIGLAEPVIPDISFAGGSMGFGLSAAVGYALSKKLKGEEGKVYCLMSDGELNCGTTWESALIASHHKLDNLIVIVDNNGFQAMGKTDDILRVSYLPIIGYVINGHNYKEIESALENGGLIYAKTTKGKGVSFMENDNIWHYKAPNQDEYELALKELNG